MRRPERKPPTREKVAELITNRAVVLRALADHESYAKARQYRHDKGCAPKYGESRFPPGFNAASVLDDGAPSLRDQPHAHFAYMFREAARLPSPENYYQTLRVYGCAYTELLKLDGCWTVPTASTEAENKRRVLSEHKGRHSVEAAAMEHSGFTGQSRDSVEAWLRSTREQAGVDPDYGDRPFKRERKPRDERIHALRREGKSQRDIAAEVGCSAMTVNRVVNAA